jgi:lipoprotein-anchoring transpeptidase ErfK/SrfK
MRPFATKRASGFLFATLVLLGCETRDRAPDADPGLRPGENVADAPQATPAPPPPPAEPDLRLEVDVAARELYVIRGGDRVATHSVAVGTSEWPTRTGEWTIGQVVWNPEWIPPDEEWAAEEERQDPGDPENPLGRAQLVYDPPRTIHGTNQPESIGQAISHGSIRVTNEVAMDLARQVMEAGGAGRDEGWYQRVRENPTERVSVAIPNPVPIRVTGGGS